MTVVEGVEGEVQLDGHGWGGGERERWDRETDMDKMIDEETDPDKEQ